MLFNHARMKSIYSVMAEVYSVYILWHYLPALLLQYDEPTTIGIEYSIDIN